jgi:hypothetical protein
VEDVNWIVVEYHFNDHSSVFKEIKMSEETVRTEEYQVSGDDLVHKVKELVHEGNIRRIIIKTSSSRVSTHGRCGRCCVAARMGGAWCSGSPGD